jgi:hypothetical protein
MFRCILKIMFCFGLVLPTITLAEAPSGVGGIANNLLQPVSLMTDFVTSGALAAGVGFLFGAFIKYMQHRKNPMASTIGNVILLLIIGILLLCLPLAYKLAYDQPPTSIVEAK